MKKDKEWLKRELIDIGNAPATGSDDYNEGFYKAFLEIESAVHQLDEPEMTEETFWKYMSEQYRFDKNTFFIKLKENNYLKKHSIVELPVIPQFVADWIEENRTTFWWKIIARWEKEVPEEEREVFEWYSNYNEDNFMRAWLDGYTIEKKKLYYVLDKAGNVLLKKKESGHVARVFSAIKPSMFPEWQEVSLKLAEQEIKDYDERYWSFAEEVTENV